METSGVVPELEILEPGMPYAYLGLWHEGAAPKQTIISTLLGVHEASPALVRILVEIVDLIPDVTEWTVVGIGHFQQPMVILGATMGGNL